MKKIIAVLLCITMVFGYSCIGVWAQTDDTRALVDELIPSTVAVSLSSAQTNAHSDVELTLSVDSNRGFSVMILSLAYPSENISLKSASTTVEGMTVQFSNQSGSSTLAFYHLDSDYTGTGAIATLTLSVGAYSNEEAAEIIISAEEGNICNTDAVALDGEFTNGTIRVDCQHTYIYEGKTEPSCARKGEIRYICTVCNDIKITYIDETPHSFTQTKVAEPDCDIPGWTAPMCEYCFAINEEEKVVTKPALGHKYGDYTVTREATCTEEGSKYRICSTCDGREVTSIPALNHNMGGTWRTTVPGDCTTAGTASLYCNGCDAVLDTRVADMTEHFMDWVVTKAPTCNEDGLKEYLCLVCGGESRDSEVIPKLDHTPAQEIIVAEPTCKESGLAEVHCKDCGTLISDRVIEKLDHTKGSLTVVEAPTAESEGSGEYRCKVCDEVIGETVVLPKTDGVFCIETSPVVAGKSTVVSVFVKNNPGFSVGIVRIKYDETSLIFDSVSAGNITEDITWGSPAAGEIAVMISLAEASYSENGLVFNINFTTTQNATDRTVELFYDAQNDFSKENGERVFFNMESGEIKIVEFMPGDANSDGMVTTADLAALKLYLVDSVDTIGKGADIDKNGKIDTGDLSGLKLHLVGYPQF